MVSVAERPSTNRQAMAEGWIRMDPQVLQRITAADAPKGDVLAVARIAAIQAAKRTWELIPLCHPLPIHGVEVQISPMARHSGLRIQASVNTHARTGVEMEALTAVQVGLLTVYDMAKALDPAMEIGGVRLLAKQGGRRGDWRHPREPRQAVDSDPGEEGEPLTPSSP
ncbi:MAG: cyclic pyranopterin monophosphate synthase MoaC [Cyanobacteria bacterium MAG CAR2_bin_4]|nr:cyclic pyranopterin monophosphate synthase MoaC [Cyanobacteria bacterium MAG CAR2_bin_4]